MTAALARGWRPVRSNKGLGHMIESACFELLRLMGRELDVLTINEGNEVPRFKELGCDLESANLSGGDSC